MIFEKLKYDAPELDKSVVFSRIFLRLRFTTFVAKYFPETLVKYSRKYKVSIKHIFKTLWKFGVL